MKYLEHRRHSMRRDTSDNGSFLSQAGVDLARRVGAVMHSNQKEFGLVITSTLNRAIQTPIAMGYAVNRVSDQFFIDSSDMKRFESMMLETGITWNDGFAAWKDGIRDLAFLRDYGESQIALYKSLFSEINDGESVLVVTHGGIVEFPLFFMFPDADYTKWGSNIGYCEGYRVGYDGTSFSSLKFLRS